jgi:hypothetical protein
MTAMSLYELIGATLFESNLKTRFNFPETNVHKSFALW